jgi:lipopolysaccharide transport system ATP-binding protein
MYELYSQNGHSSSSNSQDVLIKVQGVSKKFCRSLKRSLWYGVQDVASDLNPFRSSQPENPELRHDEFWAVNDVSFEVRRGECLGLIGHNGAGKTTLLKMLNGLIKPDKGRIEIRGRVGALIALGAGFNPVLSGRENVYVNGAVLGLKKKEIDEKIEEIIDFAEIGDFIDSPVQSYSSGMQVRLGFAVASCVHPDVLILDEILAVGDIGFQAKCLARISDIRRSGAALIFVSHNSHQLTMVCSHGILLDSGNQLLSGEVRSVLDAYAAQTSNKSSNVPQGHFSSDHLVLESVRFADSRNGERLEQLEPGKGLAIEINVEVKGRETLRVTLDIRMTDSLGTVFQASSALYGKTLELKSGRSTVVVVIPAFVRHGDVIVTNVAFWAVEFPCILGWSRGNQLWIKGIGESTGRDFYIPTYQVRQNKCCVS